MPPPGVKPAATRKSINDQLLAGAIPRDQARAAVDSGNIDGAIEGFVNNHPRSSIVGVASTGDATALRYGCDEMVTLYFLATRCDASLAFFAVAWLATQLLQLPSALVRAYTVQSFVGALAEDDWGILGSAFRKAPVALVVVWVVVAVVATVAVHSVHCKLLWDNAPSSPRSPRTARRAELTAHQRRDLSP